MMAIHLIQKFYLRTSRQMRHLDLEAKSPLYRLFTETADGAVTIRAFGWQQALTTENLQQLDFSQKPYYMMYVKSCSNFDPVYDMKTYGIEVPGK